MASQWSIINPKYQAALTKGSELIKAQATDLDALKEEYNPLIWELFEELKPEIKPIQQWADFALARIKFLKGESITDLMLANAIMLAIMTTKTKSKIKAKAIEFYTLLSEAKLSLATPFFNHLRKKKLSNLASCFIMEVGDSLTSIMKHVTYAAQISKAAGGAGINLSRIRAKGATIAGVLNAASSIMAWVRLFDQVCVSVNQLGQRPGAMTVALDIWHADIEEFLECQTENGDLRAKAFNIQPQIVLNDAFMDALQNNKKFPLYCPKDVLDAGYDIRQPFELWSTNVVPKKLVRARKLWQIIQERERSVGKPYLTFSGNMQKNSPFKKHYGDIYSTNLCIESYSYFEVDKYIHTCNLISINLGAFEPVKHSTGISETDLAEIRYAAKLAVEAADASLDLTHINIPEVHNHIQDFRTIGVGIMGLADFLAVRKLSYSNKLQLDLLAQHLSYACWARSAELAASLGACKAMANLESDLWETHANSPPKNIDPKSHAFSLKCYKEHGMRNAMLMATAPNTTTSLTMGATASFLPPYQLEFVDESGAQANLVCVKYDPTQSLYLTQFEVDPNYIIEATAVLQKWMDAGLSMELLLPDGAVWSSNKAFSEMKIHAYNLGVKAIYYIRTAEKPNSSKYGQSFGCSVCQN